MLFSTYCNRKHILSFFVHRQTLNISFTNFLARIFSVRLSTKLSRTLPECWSSLELHSFKFPDDYTKFTYLISAVFTFYAIALTSLFVCCCHYGKFVAFFLTFDGQYPNMVIFYYSY